MNDLIVNETFHNINMEEMRERRRKKDGEAYLV